MNTWQKIWEWFDGKKTTIGAGILFLAAFINEVMQGIWQLPAYPWDEIVRTLNWIGMAVAGLGAVHKAQKATQKPVDGGDGA